MSKRKRSKQSVKERSKRRRQAKKQRYTLWFLMAKGLLDKISIWAIVITLC